MHGPFPCGAYSDLKIFRLGMQKCLNSYENVIADGVHKYERCKTTANRSINDFDATVQARHETVNRRLKQFFVLGYRFRHRISRHSSCFHAVANLTQLMIENGEPLFELESSDA